MTVVLRVSNLSKSYGSIHALRGMNLAVERGQIFGVVGPNGAGKTTLFSVVSGFLAADSGEVEIDGKRQKSGAPPAAGSLSILPQDAAFLADLKLGTQLGHYGELQGLTRAQARDEARRVLELVGLGEVYDRKAKTLSHGMHKRVGIAQAFIGAPRVVILDEPTAGLDPIGAAAFDDLVLTLQHTLGLTVFMVTHDLDTLYTACDRIAVLGDRKVIAIGTVKDMEGSQHPWLKSYFHGKRGRAAAG